MLQKMVDPSKRFTTTVCSMEAGTVPVLLISVFTVLGTEQKIYK